MFIALFFVVVIIIAPIFITAYFYYDNNLKRLYFAFYLFGVIKLISGYVKGRNIGGLYIHLSETKAIIFDFKSFKLSKSSPNLFKALTVKEFKISVTVGSSSFYSIYILLLINKIINICYRVFKVNVFNELNVLDNNLSLIDIKIKFLVCFNLLCILKSVIANIINEGVFYAKTKYKLAKRKLNKT